GVNASASTTLACFEFELVNRFLKFPEATSHKLTAPPIPAAPSILLSGAKANTPTQETSPSGGSTRRSTPLKGSQRRIVESSKPHARSLPSGEKTMQRAGCSDCSLRQRTSWPVAACQSRTLPLQSAVATIRPSG